jgi:hypothetical protein
MTTHTPLTRYSATNGALASGFIIAELHQLMGHDLARPTSIEGFDVPAILFADICEKTERHHLKPVGRVPVPAEIASSDHFATATSRPTVASKTASIGAC